VPFQRQRSATQPDDSAAWPGFLIPAALLGFNPSQCCSCPRVPGRFRPGAPTCRFSESSDPVNFYRGPAADHAPTRSLVRPAADVSAAAPGFCPRGQSVPAAFLRCAAGRDCLGLGSSLRYSDAGERARVNELSSAPRSLRGRFRSLNARGLDGGVDSAAAAKFPPGLLARRLVATSSAGPSAYAAGA